MSDQTNKGTQARGSIVTKPALIRQVLFFLTVAIAAVILTGVEAASKQIVTPGGRAEATAIIAEARRIVTPNGVERLEKVRIGGIDQWVSIRGADQRNPVLLVLHGGPGDVSIPLSWWFGRGWEEYFTVIHWDQRAAGKTHLITDRHNRAHAHN
jgi:pimeloyl-ACP methyl ester carboxylesterase